MMEIGLLGDWKLGQMELNSGKCGVFLSTFGPQYILTLFSSQPPYLFETIAMLVQMVFVSLLSSICEPLPQQFLIPTLQVVAYSSNFPIQFLYCGVVLCTGVGDSSFRNNRWLTSPRLDMARIVTI